MGFIKISVLNLTDDSTATGSTVLKTDAMRDLLTVKHQKGTGIKHEIRFMIETVNPLNRFPFRLTRQLGSGGFAEVYEGYHHGKKRAFKLIPLKEIEHNAFDEYDVQSYGCHEYYLQENDFKQT